SVVIFGIVLTVLSIICDNKLIWILGVFGPLNIVVGIVALIRCRKNRFKQFDRRYLDAIFKAMNDKYGEYDDVKKYQDNIEKELSESYSQKIYFQKKFTIIITIVLVTILLLSSLVIWCFLH
ncbi:MAG: hypothetical protein K6F33_13005, partial [Bacteroidales bacterium]|nr:hypothetical protein [Bacteroidales bacterium]